MIPKYLATLAAVVLLLTLAASTLEFAARSQVLSGKTVEETWQLEFTLDADREHTYRITPQLKAALEQGITFLTEGQVQIVSANVELTPKNVSWTENRTNYTSPGAALLAHVKWDTPADSTNGAHGLIHIHFPDVPGLNGTGPTFHSGGSQKDDQGRYVLREVTVYRNGMLVSLARFSFALAAGIPVGIVLHCIFWAFQLRSEKKAILAALPQQGSQLPRTFYPDPILEWSAWTLWIGVVAFMASMMAVFAVSDGFMSSSMVWFVCGALAVGVVVGFIAVYFARRRALTVRVESNGMAYARGRGDLQWLTVGWNEILQLTEKSRTYRGNTRYWLELQFRDNRKKLKLTQSVEGYAALKALLFSVFKTPS